MSDRGDRFSVWAKTVGEPKRHLGVFSGLPEAVQAIRIERQRARSMNPDADVCFDLTISTAASRRVNGQIHGLIPW